MVLTTSVGLIPNDSMEVIDICLESYIYTADANSKGCIYAADRSW